MAPDHVLVRRQPLRYEVVIDPTFRRRGHCQQAVLMPSGDFIPGVIRLREWDEEVFLHECIHALCQSGDLLLGEAEEEVARQVSQGLYAMGWRLATDREDAPTPTPTDVSLSGRTAREADE